MINHIKYFSIFKHLLNISPINDLTFDQEKDLWISNGNDPIFQVTGYFPTGYVAFNWIGMSEESCFLKLYLGDENGFKEENSMILGDLSDQIKEKYIYIPPNIKTLRLDPGDTLGKFSFNNFNVRKVTRFEVLIKSVLKFTDNYGINVFVLKLWNCIKNGNVKHLWSREKNQMMVSLPYDKSIYNKYVEIYQITEERKIEISQSINAFSYEPLISIILPVYNVAELWLEKCIQSVLNQIYTNWELCIVDDASTEPHIKRILDKYQNTYQQIKVKYRDKNGHISQTSNTALEMANGEYIALLDHDDELSADALYEVVALLNNNPKADMIYSDEDKIDQDGKRSDPYFKPDWSPDTFLSQMYTCHLGVYRTEIVKQIGGFRKGYEGSQDYDLVLRFTEYTNRICHIPKVLYHWRTISGSTAAGHFGKSYVHNAALKALNDAVKRRKLNARIEGVEDYSGIYRIHFYPENNPLISIIIPTKDQAIILDQCLNSIFSKTTYNNFEIILVDNNSVETETFNIFKKWTNKEPERIRIIRLEMPFNYSRLNNIAVKETKGELLLLLNNDTEVITDNWLEEMAGQALRTEIGAVGSMLLYPDNSIQHAGVILVCGVAGHSHKHFSPDSMGYFSRLKMVSNYAAVTGACLMVKKELFEFIGGLDETLSVVFNDVDFCLKLIDQGYYNVWLPQVKLFHYESKSRGYQNTPKEQKRFNNEVKIMQERWSKFLGRDPFYNINLTQERENFSIK